MRVLMCEPKYYRIGAESPELNPYMDANAQPDRDLALRQFHGLVEIYISLGISVHFLRPQEELFDQVFTANVAWGVGGKFVMANLRPGWRRGEIPIAEEWLLEKGFPFPVRLPENIFFEGQGDILTTKRAYLYCYGIRNSLEAKDAISNLLRLDKPIIPLKLASNRGYHGDICIRYLGNDADKIIWFPGAFDAESRTKVESLFGPQDRLEVANDFFVQEFDMSYDGLPQRRNFPLNGIYSKDTLVFPWNNAFREFPQEVRRFVEMSGIRLILHDFSEFGLSGAGPRCCTLFLD